MDKLVLTFDGMYYRIIWVLKGEEGAYLGDYLLLEDKAPVPEDEHSVATEAAREGVHSSDHQGLYWDDKSQAQEALRRAKLALVAIRGKKALPEWAKQALAAGWKPPRDWKP